MTLEQTSARRGGRSRCLGAELPITEERHIQIAIDNLILGLQKFDICNLQHSFARYIALVLVIFNIHSSSSSFHHKMSQPGATPLPPPPPPGMIIPGSSPTPAPAADLARVAGLEAGCYVSFAIAILFVIARLVLRYS